MFHLVFGVVMGCLLLIAKLCGYWLLTGGEKQHIIRRWIIFGDKQPIRDRINESTVLLFIVDAIAGWMGMHVLAAFGGSIIAMVAMTSYTIACMAVLMKQFVVNWFKRRFLRPTRTYATPKRRYAHG